MKRAVQNLIRLIAGGLILFSIVEFTLAYLRHRADKPSLWLFILSGILLLFGGILFLGSASLAEQLTDDFDE
jgi:uncharacterized membrane protein HdeD (DUF308 family)